MGALLIQRKMYLKLCYSPALAAMHLDFSAKMEQFKLVAKVIPAEFPTILDRFFSPVLLYHVSSKRGGGGGAGRERETTKWTRMVNEGTRP